ncbi:hypothetical protein CGLO_12834 [Colletotrichum gloeosporioides Cg-14]|uniref:Uncharacterized protein n=1 Tax=Colletotrichum gloeosporioides (strain Cg-14) TaxID=1237896 RepID=T0K7M6_COLGC|nr:hypothetical protein CGLO_12834 [Colletotrichum gloeosporioides Cg-14]
MQKILYVNGVR